MYNNDNSGGKVVVLVIAMLIALGGVFFEPFVLMKYWNWFIVPATNFNQIGYWLAFGISFTFSLIGAIHGTKNLNDDDDDSSNNAVANFFTKVVALNIALLVLWGIGALIQLGV